ncbi:MAG TPA: hypothetical protein VGK74_05250 [Symbiobacteriaceae bacterium]|jgi:hypothetical protein
MHVIQRALSRLGFGPVEQKEYRPDYQHLMQSALLRVRTAELCIQEARSLEELDTARASMAAAWAEVQQLVRMAKRDRGIAVKPISETEEMHRNLRDFLNHRTPGDKPGHRKTGTNR